MPFSNRVARPLLTSKPLLHQYCRLTLGATAAAPIGGMTEGGVGLATDDTVAAALLRPAV